jgi:hypothetical protein
MNSLPNKNGESAVLYGSIDKVKGICSEERPELWPVELVRPTVAFVSHTVLRLPHCTVHLHCSIDHRTGVLITALSCHPKVCVGPEKGRL